MAILKSNNLKGKSETEESYVNMFQTAKNRSSSR